VAQKFTGTQKAAILIMQAGKERAATVLRALREQEVAEIMAEVARLHHLEVNEIEEVLNEFSEIHTARAHVAQGGYSTARELLEASFGGTKADEILDNLGVTMVAAPFEFLRRADTRQVLTYLQDEHPQTIALVLAHLPAGPAAAVLAGLGRELQADVAHRIAVMDRTSPEIVRAVETTLERKLSSMLQPAEMSRVGGVDPLVNIINRSDRSTERQIVEGLEALDAALADEVKSRMFMFEDIVNLDDRSVQLVLRQVEGNELALALKGVADPVRDKITSNLSTRAAENLVEEVELLGAVRLTQVEEAQQSIIRTIRQLEEQGQIMVRRGNEDEFVV